MAEGYKAGSIYVDFEVVNENASKELDKLEKKLKSLAKQEKELADKKASLTKSYNQVAKLYGEESKEAQSLTKKLKDLSSKENELKNSISQVKNSIQEQIKVIKESSDSVDEMAENLKKNNKNLKETKNDADGAAEGFNKLSGAITAIKAVLLGAAAQKLYEGLIIPNAELEKNLASFEILLGSYEKAQKLTDALINMAAKTPLTSTDLIGGAQQLLAVGVQMEDITDILRRLGDLSLGSAEKLQRLINAYGKINTSGKATMEYLNLFTENGIPIIQELSNVLGVSTEEFYKLSQAGKVSAEDVNKALKNMTSEGGKFYQMLDKQSQTYSGVMSTIKDNIGIIGREIGEESFEQLKDYLDDIIDEIERLRETGELDEIVKGWGSAISGAVKTVGDLIKILYEFRGAISTVLSAMAGYKAVSAIGDTMKTLGLTATAASAPLLAVGAALGVVALNLIKTKNEVDLATQGFQDVIDTNQKLFDSYNEGFEALNKQAESTEKLISTIEKLSSVENKTQAEKEQLKNTIEALNSSYEGLNIKYDEESDKLNRNISDVRNYTTEMQKMNALKLNIDLGASADKQIAEIKMTKERIRAEMEAIQQIVESEGRGKTVKEGAELERLENQFKRLEAQQASLTKTRDEYLSKSDEMQRAYEEEQKRIEDLSEAMKTDAEKMAEIRTLSQQMFNAQAEAVDKLFDNVDDVVSSLNDLSSVLSKEGKQIKLNKTETDKLLKSYPELTKEIKKTSDGYSVERKAIEDIMKAKKDEYINSLDLEVRKTQQVIESTKERLNAYYEEAAAITDLASAQEFLNKNAPVVDIGWATEEQKEAVENARLYVEQTEYLNKLLDNLENAKARIGVASSITTSGTKSQESADEKAIRNLKYNLDMGVIEQKEYYDTLELLRDRYYKEGTKQWQQYTLEITKGRKKIEEDMKKAEEAAYDTRLSQSYEWLSDEQFYGRMDNTELIAGYERMKKYTKEYYEQGKISYEKYASAIKKLDKEIYTARKNNLETSNRELSNLTKRRYDEAVKQIEDYYDELDRAEEEHDRKQEMAELRAQESLYEGAVTKTGKQRLKEIQSDIANLEKEKAKADREIEKEDKLKKLEDVYSSLETTQEEYFTSIMDYSETATAKIQELTQIINSAFDNINGIIAGAKTATGDTTSIYNNLYQTNNINDVAAGKSVVDLTAIAYRYSLLKNKLGG